MLALWPVSFVQKDEAWPEMITAATERAFLAKLQKKADRQEKALRDTRYAIVGCMEVIKILEKDEAAKCKKSK